MDELDVVIPVRFGAVFLPQAVASVLGQDGVDVHVTVVDDGCPLDLGELLAPFPPGRLTVLVNGRTPGIGGARNAGAAAGCRALIGFLDADDVWPSQRTELLARLLIEGDGADIAFGAVEQFVEGPVSDDDVPEAPRPGMVAGGMLLRRSTWERVGEFDEDLPVGEFIDWLARARALGLRERMSPELVMRRRIHGDNTTIHRRDDRQAYAEVVRRHLARLRRDRS